MRPTSLSREETQKMIDSGTKLIEQWPVFLDALEGLVKQTMQRGFSEEQARAIVTGVMAAQGKPQA